MKPLFAVIPIVIAVALCAFFLAPGAEQLAPAGGLSKARPGAPLNSGQVLGGKGRVNVAARAAAAGARRVGGKSGSGAGDFVLGLIPGESISELMGRCVRDGKFLDREFEGLLAKRLFHSHTETLAATKLFLAERDRQKAEALARGIAGTLVGAAEARRLVLAEVLNPSNPMTGELALYGLLASQTHDAVQEALTEVFTNSGKSLAMRSTAAFVIREGLSQIKPERRAKVRAQARLFLASGAVGGPASVPPELRRESIALLGGHLDVPAGDLALMKSVLEESRDREELQIALAMLLRHSGGSVPVMVAELEARQGKAADPELRKMLGQLVRSARSAIAGAKAPPSRGSERP